MTARERRREIRARVREIVVRYARPVLMLAWEDECALADFRAEHTSLIARERVANDCIREMSNV